MEHIFKQTFRQTFQIKKQFKTGTRKGGHISMKKNNDEILYNSISNIDENIIASSLVFKPKSKKLLYGQALQPVYVRSPLLMQSYIKIILISRSIIPKF